MNLREDLLEYCTPIVLIQSCTCSPVLRFGTSMITEADSKEQRRICSGLVNSSVGTKNTVGGKYTTCTL